MRQTYCYYATAFVTGFVVLSLELLGFRLLAPTFGYSIYVFGALIGVILLALSVGYILGGWLGDRGTHKRTMALLLLVAAAYLLAVSLLHQQVLDALFRVSIVTGALLTTLAFFAVPMILLASLSPFIIKILATDHKHVALSAGRIYAVGTLGSLAGTFITSFWLIPTYGANVTLAVNVALTMLVAVAWLTPTLARRTRPTAALLLVPLLLSGRSQPLRPNVVAAADSPYAHLEVKDFGDFLGLQTDRRNNLVYSLYPKDGRWPYTVPLDDLFAVPPLINHATSDLLLGLGAGSLPLLHEQANPHLAITGVEIDPSVVALGRQYFGLSERSNTRVVVDDVRPFLHKNATKHDLIEVDLFQGGGEIPFYLATKEFFTLVHERLTNHGILAMNVYDPSAQHTIAGPITNTIASVFSNTYYVAVPGGSYFVVASQQPIDATAVTHSALDVSDTQLKQVVATFARGLVPVTFVADQTVLTDDKAPLEQLTYDAIFGRR